MSVLDFLCDIRFHKSYVLPPNPDTSRYAPYRVSYADFGDPDSDAVVLLCGASMGTRSCYSPLDQLAKVYNVRIIRPDRPGIGGSQPVDLEKRIQTWLGRCLWAHKSDLRCANVAEMVPLLLAHLNITHVSLASHSGGDIYLLNIMLTYSCLLHSETSYVCFFAPWVVCILKDTTCDPWLFESTLMQDLKDSMHRSNSSQASMSAPAPIPLTPTALSMRTRGTSLFSNDEPGGLSLDDNLVVEELRRHITSFLFAECMDGISADVRLFLRKPRSVAWCSSVFWSDFDYAVPLISRMIDEEDGTDGFGRLWLVDTFHAQTDAMVGEKGKVWFDSCWMSHHSTPGRFSKENMHSSYLPFRDSYRYRSQVVEGAEHNYLMDPPSVQATSGCSE